MNWYKAYHGMPFDTKLAVVARRAGLTRAEALALWIALLDHASQSPTPGGIEGFDAEEVSIVLELDAACVARALGVLREKGLIQDDHRLADWGCHAPPSSTARVRRFRQQRREKSAGETAPSLSAENPDDEKAAAARRKRLQAALSSRHAKRGRTLAVKNPGDIP
jgi:hypothetical protein